MPAVSAGDGGAAGDGHGADAGPPHIPASVSAIAADSPAAVGRSGSPTAGPTPTLPATTLLRYVDSGLAPSVLLP